MDRAAHTPYCILIAALGGEGGGVLADWLVQCARASDLPVQATSVPGVAQRTGATSYYIELLREPARDARSPVFALHPAPATLDVVIASELLEAARMMERGFVSPQRTVLISSTHRAYTTVEKMDPLDGRHDGGAVLGAAQKLAQRLVAFDMDAAATQSGTVISAVMFGALCGAGVLPWGRDVCERVIERSPAGAQASQRGFARGFELAAAAPQAAPAGAAAPQHSPLDDSRVGAALRSQWQRQMEHWPATLRSVAAHGVLRCHDYQSAAYAAQYLQHLETLWQANAHAHEALAEAARSLALWMCFDDVVRVADLRSRRARFDKLRHEAGLQAGELMKVVEYFKPGVEELAALLPPSWGRWLTALARRRGWLGRAGLALHIRSTSLGGFLLLRGLAALRPLRPHSLRYQQEHAAIGAWLDALRGFLPSAPEFAHALAQMPALLKGYSDTHARGRDSFERLWQEFVTPALSGDRPVTADMTRSVHQALRTALSASEHSEPAPAGHEPREQTLQFIKKNPQHKGLTASR